MLKDQYTFEDLKFSSQLVRDLIAEKDTVEPIISEFFDLDKIESIIKEKEYAEEIRQDLVKAIRQQYGNLQMSHESKKNLEDLGDLKTYTVTTGHQLNLISGPLFSIYKILEVISICQELNDRFTEYQFVPVFWMATEDHDFEEINHLNLFGSKIEWQKNDQNNCVSGRLKTNSMIQFLDEVEGKFQNPEANGIVKKFTEHYLQNDDLADATRSLYNELFGEYGLLIIDGDDERLKQHFGRLMQREVEEEIGMEAVMKNNEYLEKVGYHQQVFVRECNLFFIKEDGERIRIVKEDAAFKIEDQEYNVEDLSEMIADRPQDFSPNALFRPLYQETVLPNLIYVGGGGEISYWMQLSELFGLADLQMPMLRVRDSILIANNKQKALLEELDIDLLDLRIGVDQLVKDIALNNAEAELQLSDAEALIFKAKSNVLEKVHQTDKGLEGMVEAEFSKMIKSIEKIEGKLIKAEKQKHEKTQSQLIKVRDAFFPDGGFQERSENILMYITRDANFITNILAKLKPEKTPLIRTLEL